MTRVRRYYTEGESHNAREISPEHKQAQTPASARHQDRLLRLLKAFNEGRARTDGISTIAKGVGEDIPSQGIGHHISKEDAEEEREERRRRDRENKQRTREAPSVWEDYVEYTDPE